jgi:hypothetical protein
MKVAHDRPGQSSPMIGGPREALDFRRCRRRQAMGRYCLRQTRVLWSSSRARRQVYSETTMCQTAGSDCVTIPRGRRSAPGGEVMLRASDGAMGVSS